MEHRRVWTMIDLVKIVKKVDFGKEVTLNEAIDMWCNEEYEDIIDEFEDEIVDFVKGY